MIGAAWSHVVVASRRPIDELDLLELSDRVEPSLPFAAVDRLRWRNLDGTVAVLAFAGRGAVDPGRPWHVSAGGITLFSGLPVPRSAWWRPDRSWAEQIATAGPGPGSEDYFGVFVITRIAADGTGSVSGDELGVSVVYRSDGPDRVAVGTSAAMTELSAGRPAPTGADVGSLGWLLSFDNLVGRGTGAAGVVALPARSEVAIASGGRVAVRERRLPTTEHDRAAALDAITGEVTIRLRVLAEVPRPLTVGLTGGHDSRVLLALAMAAGVADAFRWTTWAIDGSDIAVARELATIARIDHRVVDIDRPPWPAGVDELVVRSEAMLPATETASLASQDGIVVSGIGGELLGTYFGTHRLVVDGADARATFLDRVRRPRSDTVLRPDAIDRYGAALDEMIDDLAARYPPVMIPTIGYLDQRLHRWQGTVRQCGARADVAPLLTATALAPAEVTSHDERRRHAVHTALVERSAPALAAVPYAAGAASGAAGPSWEPAREVIAQNLSSSAVEPLFDVIDREATAAVLGSPRLPVANVRRQLIVADGLARWLLRR